MIIDLTPKDKTGLWFAWRPVWVGHKLAWLEHVERYYGHKGERVFWTYRLPTPAPMDGGLFWQTMETAPQDGREFVAIERRGGEAMAGIYSWEGPPNYWRDKRGCVCIRPSYQHNFVWAFWPPTTAPEDTNHG